MNQLGRRGFLGSLGLVSGVSVMMGCDPRMGLYFLQPFEPTIAHTGPDLSGKMVVVLAHAVNGANNDFQMLERDLSKEFQRAVRTENARIKFTPVERIMEWQQETTDWSPEEALTHFEADAVIFLEIEQFQIQDPSTPMLFQGHSKVHVQVTTKDYPKDKRGKPIKSEPKEVDVIYNDYRDTVFPTTAPMSVETGVSKSAFKNKFLKLVASELSWHFVDHRPGDDIQDTRING
jgi:hypothetical protein